MELTTEIHRQLLASQRNEITEHHIYKHIASTLPDAANRQTLERIAEDELSHYMIWRNYTGQDIAPSWSRIKFFTLISRLFGFTFGAKLMEMREQKAQTIYTEIAQVIPGVDKVISDEHDHEEKLLAMLDEEGLHYAGSVVLGLSDALVELTGVLAGLTFALQNVKLIALSGLITGIAASFSMAASEYLSTSSEKSDKKPIHAAIYTGITYIITVTLLILPYLLLQNEYLCLAISLTTAIAIIAIFNYYISVAQGGNYRRSFIKMAVLSLSVAALSFIIGYVMRVVLGVTV